VPQGEPIHLVTPVYIVADVARQIAGDRVDAQWWIEAGQSLDDLQQTPERRNQVRNADIVVSRGVLDPWTLDGLTNEYNARRIIRLDQLLSARDLDPRLYLWLDPSVVLELTDELTERMAALEPRNEKAFRANAAAFRQQVLTACDRIRPEMDAAKGRFMTLDRGFVPLARHFSLNEERVESINLTDPTSYGFKVLREAAKKCGAGALFVNDQTPAVLVRDWESRLGFMVVTLDAVGSSAGGSGRSSYLQVLEYNLSQLSKGMKAGKAPTTQAATTQAR
jgi:ABC-type Zn uptake system ZnuABC Zn-binding protein ZnuA